MSYADAVRKNPLTAKATDKEIEMKLKMWLRGAVDRQGGRAFRTNKKKATHAAVERGRPTELVDRAPSSPALSDSGDSSTAIVRPHVPVGPHSCSDEEEMRDLR